MMVVENMFDETKGLPFAISIVKVNLLTLSRATSFEPLRENPDRG